VTDPLGHATAVTDALDQVASYAYDRVDKLRLSGDPLIDANIVIQAFDYNNTAAIDFLNANRGLIAMAGINRLEYLRNRTDANFNSNISQYDITHYQSIPGVMTEATAF
jgi:hypothetical protein